MFGNTNHVNLTALIGHKSILFHSDVGNKHINLNPKYAGIKKYEWTNMNQIMVGFDSGWTCLINCGNMNFSTIRRKLFWE